VSESFAFLFLSPVTAGTYLVRVMQFACTAVSIVAWQQGGTNVVLNIARGTFASPTKFKAADVTSGATDTPASGNCDQNQAIIAGSQLYVVITSTSGSPLQAVAQLNVTVP
jgi:hypothetical protein